MMCNTPILFLIFKRPDVTAQVLAAIRQAQPSKIYIAADGAQPDKEGDCLPERSFFRFCEELLEYYRRDKRIMAISGDNFQQGQQRGKYSYYFSQLPHCWGWATWRRAWRLYHISLEHFEEIMAEPSYREFTHHALFNQYRYNNIVKAYRKEIDSWAYLWGFAIHINHSLSILPQINLVENIGFSEDATHTTNKAKKFHIEKKSLEFPLKHPQYMCLHKEADTFIYETLFKLTSLPQKPFYLRLYDKIRRII